MQAAEAFDLDTGQPHARLTPPSPGSFLEGIERQLERSSDRLLLLARFILVVNQLSHHLTPAGEFLGGGVEVMGDTRAVGNLEVGKSIAAFSRQRLRVQDEGSVTLPDQGGPNHR